MKIENEHIECKGESVEAEKNNQNQEIDYKLISDNIRRIREEKHISCKILAERINVTPSHIYKLESGKSKPSLEVIFKMKNVFRCSFDDLLTEREGEPEIKMPVSRNVLDAIGHMDRSVFDELVVVLRNL